MYFQLLLGVHLEGGKTYKVTFDRSDKGEIINYNQPIIKSDRDLVQAFGQDKFRRLSDQEAKVLIGEATGVGKDKNSSPVAPDETKVAKAAKAGPKEITEPPGIDVTDKFEEIEDDSVTVYFKRGKGYYVAYDEEVVSTDEPLKKAEVMPWIKKYLGD